MTTTQMAGWIESFEVEDDGQHVVLTVHDPSEDQGVLVRVSRTELTAITRAMTGQRRRHLTNG